MWQGPVHRGASKAMTPRQSKSVSAHSWGTACWMTLPFLWYQRSPVSTQASLQHELGVSPRCSAGEVAVASVISTMGDFSVKMYRPRSFGMPAGRSGRHAYFRAPLKSRSLRFFTPRMDRMRTLNLESEIISRQRSAVTDRPSSTRVWTSLRM